MYKTFVAELTEAARFGTGSEMRALLDRLEARVQIGRQADAAAAAPAAAALEAALAAARAAPLSPAVAAQAALRAALDAGGRQIRHCSVQWRACWLSHAKRPIWRRNGAARPGCLADNAVDGKGDAALAIACSKGHMNIVRPCSMRTPM